MDRAKLQRIVAANPHFTATRKMSLYSNFARLEELNPDGFEANIAAWKEVLEDALEEGAFADSTCIEAGPELVADLNDADNGMPLALSTVFDRMVSDGTLVPLSRFQQAYPSTPTSGIGGRTVRFLGWAIGLVSKPQWRSGDEGLRQEKYVSMAAVEEVSARLVKRLAEATEQQGNSRLSQVFSYDQVAEIDSTGLSATDIECSLSYAAATGKLYLDKERNVVKLRKSGPITDTDVTIASLRTQVNELTARESALGAQVEEYTTKARDAVKVNRKAAKQYLQKKAIAEKSFEHTATLLDQLQTVLHKIDDANDNQQAMAALESSSRVLSELNKGTNVDSVDTLMEQLQDEIEQTDTVTQSLADLKIGPDAASSELDELEIDNELGEMEAEAQAQDSLELPSAPKHKPGASREDAQKEPGKGQSKEQSKAKTDASAEEQRSLERPLNA